MKTLNANSRVFKIIPEFAGLECSWELEPGENTLLLEDVEMVSSVLLMDIDDGSIIIAGWLTMDPRSILSMFKIDKMTYDALQAIYYKNIERYIKLLELRFGHVIDKQFIRLNSMVPIYPMAFQINELGFVDDLIYYGFEALEILREIDIEYSPF